jgi:hypothetical protein
VKLSVDAATDGNALLPFRGEQYRSLIIDVRRPPRIRTST